MTTQQPIRALFLDIGGVLLTNGWDRHARRRAAQKFDLDYDQLDERHHLTFDTYESGKLSLDEYLSRIVFYQPRTYSRAEFTQFIMEQSEPFTDMIDLVCQLKTQHNLKLMAVNNEGREINEYRIKHFKLGNFFDAFVSSCYAHFRKPDTDIFQLALDIAQLDPVQVIYIDDRLMFTEVAATLGMQCIHHLDYETTRQKLADAGLVLG